MSDEIKEMKKQRDEALGLLQLVLEQMAQLRHELAIAKGQTKGFTTNPDVRKLRS